MRFEAAAKFPARRAILFSGILPPANLQNPTTRTRRSADIIVVWESPSRGLGPSSARSAGRPNSRGLRTMTKTGGRLWRSRYPLGYSWPGRGFSGAARSYTQSRPSSSSSGTTSKPRPGFPRRISYGRFLFRDASTISKALLQLFNEIETAKEASGTAALAESRIVALHSLQERSTHFSAPHGSWRGAVQWRHAASDCAGTALPDRIEKVGQAPRLLATRGGGPWA